MLRVNAGVNQAGQPARTTRLRIRPGLLLVRAEHFGLPEAVMFLGGAIAGLFFLWNVLPAIASLALYLVAAALLLMLMVGRETERADPELSAAALQQERWLSLAAEQPAPATPADGYRLWVAEKSVNADGAIHFACVDHEWRLDRWSRIIPDPFVSNDRPSEDALPGETWEAGTPIETIAAAWADYCQSVRELNEPRFAAYQQAQVEQAEAHARAEQAEQLRLEQLEASRQLIELLPGQSAPQPPQPGELPDPFLPELARTQPSAHRPSEAEQIARFLDSPRILRERSKHAR